MQSFPEKIALDGLDSHLVLHPPTAAEKAPAALQFERFREVEIDWADLVEGAPDGITEEVDSVLSIRHEFERGWREAGENPEDMRAGKGVLWTREPCHWLTQGSSPREVTNGLQLIEYPSRRRYLLLDKSGNPVGADPSAATSEAEAKDALWGSLDDLEQVAPSAAATDTLPSLDYVGREVMLFRDEFQRLDAQLRFAEKVKQVADQQLAINGKDLPEDVTRWWREEEARHADQLRYANLSVEPKAVEERIRVLAERVAQAGYTLALEDDAAADIKRGDVYTGTKRTIRWTSSQVRYKTVVKKGSCGKKRILRIPYRVPKQNVKVADERRTVSFTVDPVREEIKRLRGLSKQVYEVIRTAEGLRTPDGEALAEILHECWRDEDFRTKCVVVVPDYAPFLSGHSQYLGAAFYHNPLPPTRPTRFPRLALREELSYTTMWKNSELGQLVGSINLGPGEERTIKVTRSFTQEVKNTSSFSSTSELASSRSLDLSTAIENEATSEFSKQKNFSGSVSGGFKIGPFGAKASTDTSRSSSLRNFSRSVSKVARKAVQNLNKKMSQEVTTTFSRTTTVDETSAKEITLQNINQGRTLNLFLYQINNHFVGGTYLDGLALTVAPGSEVIGGSGLFETYTYRLDQLEDVLEHFLPDRVPLQVPLLHPADSRRPSGAYWNKLLNQLVKTLQREYMISETPGGKRHANYESSVGCLGVDIPPERLESGAQEQLDDEALEALRECTLLDLLDPSDQAGPAEGDDASDETRSGERLERLKRLLEGAILHPKPLEPDELIVASGGLYMDAVVGMRPSTEPYAESMRSLERDKLAAEVERERARTRSLFGDSPDPRIVGIEVSRRDGVRVISMRFDPALPHDRWRVFYRGRLVPTSASLALEPVDGSGATLPWPVGWKNPGREKLEERLHLEEIDGLRRVFFVETAEA